MNTLYKVCFLFYKSKKYMSAHYNDRLSKSILIRFSPDDNVIFMEKQLSRAFKIYLTVNSAQVTHCST